jgi:hypothetical protein
MVPVRLREHPEVQGMDQARTLIDAEVSPAYWRDMAGMAFEGDTPERTHLLRDRCRGRK